MAVHNLKGAKSNTLSKNMLYWTLDLNIISGTPREYALFELVAVNVNIDLHGLPVGSCSACGLRFAVSVAISIPIVRFQRANAQGVEGERLASKQTLISLVLLQAPEQGFFFFIIAKGGLTAWLVLLLLPEPPSSPQGRFFAFDRPSICYIKGSPLLAHPKDLKNMKFPYLVLV